MEKEYMVCPRCGSNNLDKAKKCLVCGMAFDTLSNKVNNNGAHEGYFSVASDLGINQFHNEQNNQKNDSLVQERNTMIYPENYEIEKYTSVKKDKRNKTVATSVISICLIAVVGVCLYLFVSNRKIGDAKDENTNNNSEVAEYEQAGDNRQEEAVEDNGNTEGNSVVKDEEIEYRKRQIDVYDSEDVLCAVFTYEYDIKGNLIVEDQKKITDNGGMNRSIEYEYDENGNCTAIRNYSKDYNTEMVTTYGYDAENRRKKKTEITPNSSSYSIFEYDNNGDVVKESAYIDDELSFWDEYVYDEDHNVLKSDFYFPNDEGEFRVLTITYYSYDNGNLIKKEATSYNDEGNVHLNEIYMYEYDEFGNITREEKYTNDSIDYSSEWKYEYDENGNVLVVKSYGSNGYSGKSVYEYETY